jgi:beta-lactamase regulating signal transducer with metallopeptidase domain
MIDIRDFAQQATVDALAWTLLHFLWQGAALGFLALTLLRVARPERATTRYAIGVATLGLMLITSIATFAFLANASPRPVDSGFTLFPAIAPDPHQLASIDETVNEVARSGNSQSIVRTAPTAIASWRPAPLGPTASFALVLLWGIGVLALSLRLLGGWLLTRSLTRHAISAVSPAIIAAAEAIGERLRLRRAVAIVESGGVAVPTLVGWIKPVVLLPAAALSGLSPEQLQAILAHELAHVRRHDYLVNLLQSMVETLLFYHPATWWVSAQVRAEREHCCDDLAVEVCGDRLVYVTALAELTTITSHRAFALAATDGSLVGRVQRILGRPRSMHEPAPAWALLALFVLIAGGIGSFQQETNAEAVTAKATRATSIAKPTIAGGSATPEPISARATVTSFEQLRRWFDPAPPPPAAPPAPAAPEAPPTPPAPIAVVAPTAPALEAPRAPAPPQAPDAPPTPPASASARSDSGELRRDLAGAAFGREGGPQEISSRGSGNMSWSDGSERLTVNWTGAFRLSDDEKDISWMEDGARLIIADGVLFKTQVELRGANGRIERTFSKNGMRRDYEPEGREFLAAVMNRLINNSGLFAKERVAKYLKQGGPDAVLAEIDKLGESSYTHRVYYTELARQANLDESLLTKILARVPKEISSDYDKATLFTAIVKQPAITTAHRVQIARAVQAIKSDYDQRRTLSAVIGAGSLSESVATAVMDAAATINSSHDRSLVLTEVVERGGVTLRNRGQFHELVRSMSSSYDQRRVLSTLGSQVGTAREVLTDAIASTAAMSSHDQSETLIKLIDSGGLTDESAEAFFLSASKISSSHDLSRVLRKAADQPGLTNRLLEGVLRVAARINSSHDRANLLEAIAGRHNLSGTSRQNYIDAANGMGTHDSNRALAALVRAENRR